MIHINDLRSIFRNDFNPKNWQNILTNIFHADEIKVTPEPIPSSDSGTQGFYYGAINTQDGYRIGIFMYEVSSGSVTNKKVGLRSLVRSFINPTWGEFDAALAVFNSGDHWRLSFISDIKGDKTAPKRYTYVFGDKDNYYNTPVGRFAAIQGKPASYAAIREAFSVEALTKQFYNDLFNWYQWAISPEVGITFPDNSAIEEGDREDIDTKIIRLITRMMFVWFIKQKGLVPDKIFDTDYLSTILKDFDPIAKKSGVYYNAILQNLFFATLNRAIVDEEGNRRGFAELKDKRDVKTLYRYAELFTISKKEVIDLFSEVPFLNGGLFECLDKNKTIDGVEHAFSYDGFSRNDKQFADGRYRQRAFIPNIVFFEPEKGLLSILSRYNFTIEENTPNEQHVALDPELLGKVFENLLGAYNPETKETARNQSGSFYTPREIVNYMVDESILAYLGNTDTVRVLINDEFTPTPSKSQEYAEIASRLRHIKVLDPACGSGAFPMGLLNRLVDILQKIHPEESIYDLKLSIIENCIYGGDIQCIASQITKLRFFISLICDCEKDATKPNFGIPTLPNLETKFVATNSLISIKKRTDDMIGSLFEDPEIEPTKASLRSVRHEHFMAKSASAKNRLRDRDHELRDKLASLLRSSFDAPEDAHQLASWNPYDQNAVAGFFDPEWMFDVHDGFDIVIGNPPYIQLQNNGGELNKLYQGCGFQTFASTGDIYCLFYERGYQLLKEGGHLCYITSNKWMRAGYGEKTRAFLANNTNPELLIDFGGVKIFESATVDTNILLFSKAKNQHKTRSIVLSKNQSNSVNNLSDFVQQNGTFCDFKADESWVVLSNIERSIKQKIEAVGTPLKDWDIQIYRGVLTGCNEAFIIDGAKRDEILNNCQTVEEREKTDALIRPILRGRDIKRYGYNWADLYLIATFPSRHYDIDEYPAVKDYLLSFGIQRLEQTGKTYIVNGEKIKSRKKTNNKWFETQDSISYWEDFDKPKIVFQEIVQESQFMLDRDENFFCNDTCRIINGNHLDFLLGILNSQLFFFATKRFYGGGSLGEHGVRMKHTFFSNFPCVAYNKQIAELALQNTNAYMTTYDKIIEELIDSLYQLTKEEIAYISASCTSPI